MTTHILGLGESLIEYLKAHRRGKVLNDCSIGVNDIDSTITPDYVVCIDKAEAFSNERAQVIRQTECKGFYSQVEDWRETGNYKRIELEPGRGVLKNLDSDKFCYSISSPFVACVLAYKLGADKIVLHGVDFITHKNFKDNRREKALNDFRKLQSELNKRGVELLVSSKFSALSEFLPQWSCKN